jgi:hypothetical protein
LKVLILWRELGSPIGLFDAVKSIATARESCNPLLRISTKEGRLIKLNYVKLILPALPDPFCSFSSYSFLSFNMLTVKSVTPTTFPEVLFAIATLMGALTSALQT